MKCTSLSLPQWKCNTIPIKHEYISDDKGNIILFKHYDAENKLTKTIKYEYEYDSENRIIKQNTYKEDRLSGYETFVYNEAGKPSKHMHFTPEGRPISGELKKFDQ